MGLEKLATIVDRSTIMSHFQKFGIDVLPVLHIEGLLCNPHFEGRIQCKQQFIRIPEARSYIHYTLDTYYDPKALFQTVYDGVLFSDDDERKFGILYEILEINGRKKYVVNYAHLDSFLHPHLPGSKYDVPVLHGQRHRHGPRAKLCLVSSVDVPSQLD